MKTIYIESLALARKKMKEMIHVNTAILFRNLNEKPIAAWVPDGRSGGSFVTQSDIKKRPDMTFHHNYAGNQDAFFVLKQAALKNSRKEKAC
jgi:hypothetical protein